MVVRGHEEDGLNPIYISSPKARNYLEDHLKIDSDHFVTLLECSVIGGAAAVANQHRTDTQIVKSQVRAALLDSLRKAATSTASDGSEPMITDPSLIPAVSYSDYVSFVDQYKIEAFNWLMNEEKDKLIDPSNVGGHKTLLAYLKLIRSGDSGFRRMTQAAWDAWKEARDQREVVIPTKRAQPKRSRPVPNVAEEQPAEEQQASKKARKATHQTKTKPKTKAKAKAEAKEVGPTSEQATETSNSDAPVGGTAGEEDYPSENDFGPPVSPPSPSTVSVIPRPTVSDARPNWTDTTPASPPLPEELRITINRRPRTPPTPSTVSTSSLSPTFLLHRVPTQAHYDSASSNPSQNSPRGRRSYHNSWDRTFINHTPDSMSSGRPASRSCSPASRSCSPASRSSSPASRSNNPTSRMCSLDKSRSSTAISPLVPSPVGISLPSSSLNHDPSAHDFYHLRALHAATPPPFNLGPSEDWLGASQSPLFSSEWDFSGPHTTPLRSVHEPSGSTLALPPSEFASPDA
ncbi:hypothetical protein FRC08_017159 [Ceratobasidium sp. 394]|nr:hypothetical protein FRC08_017159 [Ceratobasidium sp. 394]